MCLICDCFSFGISVEVVIVEIFDLFFNFKL